MTALIEYIDLTMRDYSKSVARGGFNLHSPHLCYAYAFTCCAVYALCCMMLIKLWHMLNNINGGDGL